MSFLNSFYLPNTNDLLALTIVETPMKSRIPALSLGNSRLFACLLEIQYT